MKAQRILAGLSVALAAAGGAFLLGQEEDGLHWHERYSSAVEEARRTGKPIFLEYRCEP